MEKQLDMFESKTFFNKDQTLKTCHECERSLPLSCFRSIGRYRKDGTSRIQNVCTECKKTQEKTLRYLKQTIPEPDNNYKCPICLAKKENLETIVDHTIISKSNTNWVMDHNHETNEFRGWLCNTCNSALGWLNDDINRVRRAVDYLEKNEKSD